MKYPAPLTRLFGSLVVLFLLLALPQKRGWGQDLQIDGIFVEFNPFNSCDDILYILNPIINSADPLSYEWNTGEITSTLFVFEPGCYSVTVTDANGNQDSEITCLDESYFLSNTDWTGDNMCPLISSQATDSVFCEQACVGETVNYTIDNITTFTIEVVQVYDVDNGVDVDFDLLSNGLTVTWDQAGVYTGLLGSVVIFGPGGSQQDSSFTCYLEEDICIVIHDIPQAALTTTPAATNGQITLCQGQPLYLDYTGTEADNIYWLYGDGSSDEGLTASHTYDAPGTYDLQLVAVNGDCNCQDTVDLQVVVTALEAPAINCISTLCANMIGTYTTDSDCGTFTWSVSGNGSIIGGGGSTDDFVTVQWISGPAGTISLLTEDCPSLACAQPTTLEVPVIDAALAIAGPNRVCPGSEATYRIPDYQGTDITWSVTGGIATDQSQHNEFTVFWPVTLATGQTYEVSVEVDNCYLECNAQATLDVTVQPPFIIEGELEACPSSTLAYQAFVPSNADPIDVQWSLQAIDGGVLWQSASATATENIPVPTQAGLYRIVALPGNPADYCTDRAERTIRVLPLPDAATAIEGPGVICPDETVTYTAIGTTSDTYVEWTILNGGSTETMVGNPINVTWGSTPPYQISAVQINTEGAGCTSDAILRDIVPLADLSIAGPAIGCLEATLVFDASPVLDIDYQWEITPASAATIVTPPDSSAAEILWHQVGNATVQVSACGLDASAMLTVQPPPTPEVTAPDGLCPGETATITTTLPYAAYVWTDSLGNMVSTDPTPDLPAGSYRLAATDDEGCVGETHFQISSYPAPDIHISTPDPWIYCGQPPTVNMYATNTEEGYSYLWYREANPVGANMPTHTTSTPGIYYVIITNQSGCTAQSNEINIREDCTGGSGGGGGGGGGSGSSCESLSLDFDFTISTGSVCEEQVFTNISSGQVPGSAFWEVYDQEEDIIASGPGDELIVVFGEPTFYRVRLILDFPDPNNPGEVVTCDYWKVGEVPLIARFETERVCASTPFEFTDLSTHLPTTSITNWQWDFGDPASGAANTSALPEPSHLFSSPGDYTVQLTVTDGSGCLSQYTQIIQVPFPPQPAFELPAATCANIATEFIPTEGSLVSVQWDFGNPASGDANTQAALIGQHRYETPGTYTVTLQVEDQLGCTGMGTQEVTIVSNPLFGDITSLPVPPTICEGNEATLTSPPGGTLWSWSNGGTTESITTGTEGVYALTLTDGNGCTHQPEPVAVDILPEPTGYARAVEYDEDGFPIEYYYDEYEICYGNPVVLETADLPGYTYSWSIGGTVPSIEFSEEKGNLLDPGTYDIDLTLTDTQTGCSTVAANIEVTILPPPATPAIAQTGPWCSSGASTLEVSSPQADLSYTWSNNANGATIPTSIPGTYWVTATNDLGCEAQSETVEVLPAPEIPLVPAGCYTRCDPDTICLLNNFNYSYQWFLDGAVVPAPDGTVSELIATESGTYTLEITDLTNGCTGLSDPLVLEITDGVGNLIGQTYMDVNDNGVIDTADTLISNIPLDLLVNGSVQEEISSQLGGYGFLNLPSNTAYTIVLDTLQLADTLEAVWVNVDTTLMGCDEVITIDWLVRPSCTPTAATLALSACEGESATHDGTDIPAGDEATFNYTNTLGCDSTLLVQVAALPTYEEALNLTACDGETLTHDGTDLVPGANPFTYTTTDGCDSLLTINLQALPPVTTLIELPVCPDSTVVFEGVALQAGESTTVVLVDQNGCDSTVTATALGIPAPEVTILTADACPDGGGNIAAELLFAPAPPYTFALDGGSFSIDPLFADVEGGDYVLRVRDGVGCTGTYPVQVAALPALSAILTQDSMRCDQLTATLEAQVLSGDDDALTLLWEDGEDAPLRTVETPGLYSLQITNSCESIQLSTRVDWPAYDPVSLVYVPNAFSPNGDGRNDVFQLHTGPDTRITALEFFVYDRFGGELFYTNNPLKGWDGQCDGRAMNTGVYVWHLSATVVVCGREVEVEQQGGVQVVR